MKNSAAVSCVCFSCIAACSSLLLVTFLDSLFTTQSKYQFPCPSSRGENVLLNEFTSSILLFFTFSLFSLLLLLL